MSNIFSKILPASFFQQKTSDSIVGIDIGSTTIKVVEIRSKGGKALLETYGALSLAPYANPKAEVGAITNLSAEAISTALKDLLKEANVKTTFGAVSIPSSASLVFVLSLPGGLSPAELPNVISSEARKYIPVPLTEVSLDWLVIPSDIPGDEENKTTTTTVSKQEILVVAIHNDVLKKYQEILKLSGITVTFFELELFSTIRSTFGRDKGVIMVLDIGGSKTKLAVAESGIIKQFHTINRGSFNMTESVSQSLGIPFAEAEALKKQIGLTGTGEQKRISEAMKVSTSYIFSEASNVMLSYERKYNKAISKVILTGGGSLLIGIKEFASESLRAPVVFGNPFNRTEAPAFLEPILESIGPEFTVSVGLALRSLQ